MQLLPLSLSLVALLAGPAVAQCGLQLHATTHVTGPVAVVYASATMPNSDVVIGGLFTGVDGTPVSNIARRSGASWTALGSGLDGVVNALVVMPNGDLVAGGTFTQAGGVAAASIARWNGVNWSPLGTGLTGSQVAQFLGVRALLVRPNGDLVAGGHFLNAGGTAVSNIAAWNGTAWSSLAGGIPGSVNPYSPPPLVESLANLPNGDLAATGGALSVQRWNGTSWSAMNTSMSPTTWLLGPKQLFVASSGSLFACGREQLSLFSPTLPFVRQWNGSAWINFGSSLPGAGVPLAMTELPNGEIVVGGLSIGSSTASGNDELLRSAGAGWTAIAATRSVALSMQADGSLLILAGFNGAGVTTGAVAELVSGCPASVASVGAACAGSLGVHALTPTSLPWLGSTFGAVATAVPSSAIALAVWSLSSTTLPLSVVTPVAGTGCEGLVAAGLSEVLVPLGNQVTSRLVLPSSPVLAGLPVYHYVAVIEFGPSATPIQFTSTGRLALTLGVF